MYFADLAFGRRKAAAVQVGEGMQAAEVGREGVEVVEVVEARVEGAANTPETMGVVEEQEEQEAEWEEAAWQEAMAEAVMEGVVEERGTAVGRL
jgi:hypothetical protein